LKIQTLQKHQIPKVTNSALNAKKNNTLGRLFNEYNNNRHNWHGQHLVI
jgi:hypothetical protein